MKQTTKYRGYVINIHVDQDPIDPRGNDNLGTMVCWHRRYNLGDKHEFQNNENFIESISVEKCLILPLRLYDHSGISMSTSSAYPYNDRWDSMQVGYIYVTYEKLREEYSWKKITPERLRQATEYLRSEVKEYDQYLKGDVYTFEVLDAREERHVDSCAGFYGCDHEENGLLDHARSSIDGEINARIHEHAQTLKSWIKSKVNVMYRNPLELA